MEHHEGRGRSAEAARFWLIVVAVALAASLFRFSIARYSLWFDEQASMFFARQPIGNLWGGWMIREPNPPLYYSLLKYWMMLFGDTDRATRALSIAAGAAGIGTTALFAARTYGRNAGIMAAALTALSAQQLYYSLQVRGYELLYLASSGVLISLVAIDRSLRQGRGWTNSLIGYALGCTACIYLHTTMLLLPVICSLSIIVVRRHELRHRPTLLLPLLAANLAIALSAAWWLDIAVRQMLAGTQNIAVFDKLTPWLIVKVTIGTLSFAKETGVSRTVIALIVTLIAVYGARRNWSKPETKLMVAVLGISIALTGLISVAAPIFMPRTVFWLSAIATAFCAAAIAGIDRRPTRWLVAGALGLLVTLNMATSVKSRQPEDWDGAIARAESIPGSRLIVQSEAMGLLLTNACARRNDGRCPVPIIAVTTPDDRLDGWSSGLYSGPSVAVEHIDAIPSGRYFVFRKEFYHDLLTTLHRHGKARSLLDDPPLTGPVDRSALVR